MPGRSQITSFALDVVAGLLIFALSWAKADKSIRRAPSIARTMIISIAFGAACFALAFEYLASCYYAFAAAVVGVVLAPRIMSLLDSIVDGIKAAAEIKIASSVGTTADKLRERVEAMRNETGGVN